MLDCRSSTSQAIYYIAYYFLPAAGGVRTQKQGVLLRVTNPVHFLLTRTAGWWFCQEQRSGRR